MIRIKDTTLFESPHCKYKKFDPVGNQAVYKRASDACGWAGGAIQVILTSLSENTQKVKVYRLTNKGTDTRTDCQTDGPTD